MFGKRSHSNDGLGNKMVDEILSLKCRVGHMEGNMEITTSNLTPTIQNRDPDTVTGTPVKLFCCTQVQCWALLQKKRRTEQETPLHHHYLAQISCPLTSQI